MRILFCGDVVGKAGREVLTQYIPKLKSSLNIDIIIVNGENSAHGFGITQSIAEQMFGLGVNVITLGNHSFDNKNIIDFISNEPKLIRPINYEEDSSGNGFYILPYKNLKVLVVNLLGKLFMSSKVNFEDPFVSINNFLKKYELKKNIDAIVVDFHSEATSEKNAMAFFLDGKVSAVLGTHTHIPTNDARILEKGTGFMSDVGMCGDYDSIIGMDKNAAMGAFFFNEEYPKQRFFPATKKGTLSGVVLEINEETGKCTKIKSVIYGNTFNKEQAKNE